MDLIDLVNGDDEDISAAAALLEAARIGLQTGELTREQFDELAEDALQIEEMDELADDLERKIAVQDAIKIFKAIIGAIPK